MIIGILLGISAAVSLASLGIIITGLTGVLKENIATGAAIGTTQAVSYATIPLAISLVAVYVLITILRKQKRTN